MTDFPDEETSSAMLEALRGPRAEPTLQPCAACQDCTVCHGVGLVTLERNHEYLATRGVKEPEDDPGDRR